MAVSGREYFRILSSQRVLAVGVLVLLFFAGDWRGFARRIAGFWTVWLPAVITLLLYSMGLVDPRYLPGAVVVFLCSVLASFRLPRLDTSPRLINGGAIAVSFSHGITITYLTLRKYCAV